MATWDDVRRLVATMPGTDEHPSYGGLPSWRVSGRGFVWERPLGASERAALGDAALPADVPLLGVRVADEGEKQALLHGDPRVFLTTPHFDGHPVVLVRLDRVADGVLAELVEDAWCSRAPRRLLAEREHRGG